MKVPVKAQSRMRFTPRKKQTPADWLAVFVYKIIKVLRRNTDSVSQLGSDIFRNYWTYIKMTEKYESHFLKGRNFEFVEGNAHKMFFLMQKKPGHDDLLRFLSAPVLDLNACSFQPSSGSSVPCHAFNITSVFKYRIWKILAFCTDVKVWKSYFFFYQVKKHAIFQLDQRKILQKMFRKT